MTAKKRNKPYRPREVRLNIMATLFEGDQPLPDDQRTTILLAARGSVAALVRGTATKDDWHTIVNALNTSQVLCESAGNRHIGLAVIHAAQNAMIEVGERCKRTGKLGISGDGLRPLNDVIELYEQLLETVTKRQHAAAIHEADRRIRDGNVVRLKKEGTRRLEIAGLAA